MITTCVIGGTGAIGRHVLNLLLKKKRRVVVLGRKDKKTVVSLPNDVTYYSHDYGDVPFITNFLSGVDEVICLAYTTNPKTSYDNPITDLLTNLLPMVNLFQLASKTQIKKLIVVSSGGAVYGPVSKIPIREDCPTNPISPYGITKLAIEKYALMFHEINRLPVVIVRPGNSYGPGQKPFTGQGFVATTIGSILLGKEVVIFGTKGTVRDYVYVTDIAKGIVAAMEHGENGICYNLGSGKGRDNIEVLNQITALATKAGFKVNLKIFPKRPFDVETNILNSSLLKRDTKWKPQTNFGEGIRLTWDWYVNNQDKWRQ